MSAPMSARSSSRGPRALPFPSHAVQLDGWAQSPRWELTHYLVNTTALCAVPTVRAGLALVGTLKGRRCCPRCLDALGRGAP